MSRFLYSLAILLVVAWLIGFFAYNEEGMIHLLLLLALIAALLRMIKGKDPV